jgi:hypothetical protein
VNQTDIVAYGMVAQAIAQHAFAMADANWKHEPSRPRFPGTDGPIFDHHSDSTFEAVAHDLWRLGILSPLDEVHDWAYNFVFACDVAVSNIAAEGNCEHGPSLFDLLVTFINLFSDFGTEYWGFSVKSDISFGQDSRIKPTLEALAATGFLIKANDGFTWTERIAPMMRASYFDADWPQALGGSAQT